VPGFALLLSGFCLHAYAQSLSFPIWQGYGGDAQHTALDYLPSQHLTSILWQSPTDTNPPYSGNELFIHYGEACVSPLGTIIAPQRQNNGGFIINGLNMTTGKPIWSATTAYTAPAHNWIPSYGPTLVPASIFPVGIFGPNMDAYVGGLYGIPLPPMVAWAESGGRVVFRTSADAARSTTTTVAFYGNKAYLANQAAYDNGVQICTPLTAGPNGAVYFGYTVSSALPNQMSSGIAEVRQNGYTAFISASQASGDAGISQVQMNCAPAVSKDGRYVYIASAAGYSDRGYLLCLNATTLQPVSKVALMDPYSNSYAAVLSDSTSSPMVGPDGSVFFGVFESSYGTNHARGYELHFTENLGYEYTPGSFGWDITPSVVPSYLVPSYTGTSTFLLMSKYNNYAETGGDGVNKIALLDPYATETDPYNGTTVMKEVATLTGPTADGYYRSHGYPNAVREWCINSAAVDVYDDSIIVNCEDGTLYRWNLSTLQISESISLTAGIGEAYTPTVIAPTGQVFAINNAILFCVGGKVFKPDYSAIHNPTKVNAK